MAYILSLATELPSHAFLQSDIAHLMIEGLSLPEKKAKELRDLYLHSQIQTRYSVLPDLRSLFCNLSTQERNAIYKEQAPKLAIQAAKKALENIDPQQITHVICVSCTGMMAPGLEYHLMQALNLKDTVSRTGINFMGCFGAFNALSVARAFAKENINNKILIVCTELCSLHGQLDGSSDSFLANALFADGAAACVVGANKEEGYLWEIVERSCKILEQSAHLMSWEAGNHGYFMKLSPKVPIMIKKHIRPFVEEMIGDRCLQKNCLWAIHPGGKSILDVIEKTCELSPDQTKNSWQTLKDQGNMSSATFLFVLEKSLKQNFEWTIGLGFGPGLCVEGVLLRR